MSSPSPQSQSLFSFSSLLTEAGTVFSARVAGVGLSFVVQILFARWAGPDHYGIYSYAMSWTALLTTVSGLGFPEAIIRFLPEYQSDNRWGPLLGVIQRSEHIVAGVSCFLALASSLFVLSLPSVLGVSWRYVVPLILGFSFIPPSALLRLQKKMCIARQQMRIAFVLPHLLRPISMIGGAALLVLWLQTSLTAADAVLIAGLPLLLVWPLQRWAFRRQLPTVLEQTTSVYKSAHWLRVAFPMFLITGFVLLLNKTDLLMIGLMADPKHVGLYKVATKTASLILFPMTAVGTVATPRIAKHYANQDQKQLQNLVSTAARWMLGSSLVVTLGLLLTSELVLGLFGPSFLQSKSVLWILIGGQLTHAAAGSVASLLSMTGHQNESAKVYGTCALLNVGLNAIGIWLFGIVGAAIATTVSTTLLNGGLYRLVVRKLDIYPSAFDVLRSTTPT